MGVHSRLTFFQQQLSGQARSGWQPARLRCTSALRVLRRRRVSRKPAKAPPRPKAHGAHEVVYRLAGTTKTQTFRLRRCRAQVLEDTYRTQHSTR